MRWVSLIVAIASVWCSQGSHAQSNNGMARRQLTMMMFNQPPYVSITDGKPSGIMVRVLRELSENANIDINYIATPLTRAIEVARRERDTCVTPLTHTASREMEFSWVRPVFRAEWALYAEGQSTITLRTLDDAKKYRIGVLRRGSPEEYFANLTGFDLENADSDEANLNKLLARRIDLWAVRTDVAESIFHLRPTSSRAKALLTYSTSDVSIACGLSTDPILVTRLQEALDRLKTSGELERLSDMSKIY